jgi:hypothetical protein
MMPFSSKSRELQELSSWRFRIFLAYDNKKEQEKFSFRQTKGIRPKGSKTTNYPKHRDFFFQ